MRKIFLFVILFCVAIYGYQPVSTPDSSAQIIFDVNLTNYADDLFHVSVSVSGLTDENDIYNLPATAPGTYEVMDFGRFVKSLKAYDDNGNELNVDHISTNRWEIPNVDKLAKLVYDIEDSFDSEAPGLSIDPMSGTGIDSSFIVLNTFGVLGFFEGLQSNPVKLKVDYKSDWTIGTALDEGKDGFYYAETYDRLADCPILIGDLTTASSKVNDINVGIYMYSPDTSLTAGKVLNMADDVLQAAGKFIGYSPTDHYDFLFCFMSPEDYQKNNLHSAGALEHCNSSLFVFPSRVGLSNRLRDDMAHEFMHILTPLNLHSNFIQPYNFEVPTASEHIWLYEGVTEWEAHILQLRSGLITPEEYLKNISEELNVNDHFDQSISLTEMSKEVYTEEGRQQFFNFYNRGAVTAAMLDIRLLELSHGKRGLRNVLLDLLKRYGKNKPFNENEFFDILVKMTYPEIQKFIDGYIKGIKPLPYEAYMKKLGYRYIAKRVSEDKRPSLGIGLGLNDKNQFFVREASDELLKDGVKLNDVILKALGQEVNLTSAHKILEQIMSMQVGDTCKVVVERDGKEIEIPAILHQRMDKHIFEDIGKLTDEQKFLRDAWMRNL
jgi:predicted metalloprotease with PDZ domain